MQHKRLTIGRRGRDCSVRECQKLHSHALGDLGLVAGRGLCCWRLLGGALDSVLLAFRHTCKLLQGTQRSTLSTR